MSSLSIVAAPTGPRGFVAKAGALAAGTAFAGATLFGGAIVTPGIAPSYSASVQHDYVLTADGESAFPTFTESLQSLFNVLGFGTMGDVLGVFGEGIGTGSSLADLLTLLNPDNVSLDKLTIGLLSADFGSLLDEVQLPGGPDGALISLGDIPIDNLIGQFIGGAGAGTELGTLLGYFGLEDYAGLLNLSFLGIPLTADTSLADLLNEMLGIGPNTSINDLLEASDMQDATIASLLGITPEQLAGGWDDYISSMVVGGSLSDPDGTGTLGEETLGALLTGLLPVGSTDTVGDGTLLTDFLGDLGIWEMLGIS